MIEIAESTWPATPFRAAKRIRDEPAVTGFARGAADRAALPSFVAPATDDGLTDTELALINGYGAKGGHDAVFAAREALAQFKVLRAQALTGTMTAARFVACSPAVQAATGVLSVTNARPRTGVTVRA